MHPNPPPQNRGSGYASGPVTKPPDWHGLVTWDLLFNALSTGLFLVMAMADLARPTEFAPLAWLAYPVALAFLTADLVCLVLDLGDPWRFHHMLRVFKPSSPMSLGTWCLTAYSLPLTVIVAVDLLLPGWAWSGLVHRTAVVLGLMPALGSAVYKGVLFSTTSQPGWGDARWLGAYQSSSALVLGTAQLLLLAMLSGQAPAATLLRPALVALIAVNAVPLALLLRDLRPTLALAEVRGQLRHLAAWSLALGAAVPVVLLLGGLPWLTLLAIGSLALGSHRLRDGLVRLPHVFA